MTTPARRAAPRSAPRTAARAAGRPTLRLERRCWSAGARVVCGVDEVGRGAWAGPVTVAAVVPARTPLAGVRDSKQLALGARARVADDVVTWAVAIGIGHAGHEECDALGMTAALRAAGRRALAQLAARGYEPDRVILDGNHDYLGLGDRVTTLVHGDATSLAVAAASVVAKVTRDGWMAGEAEHFPAYGFESNRGYPSPAHVDALSWYGPSSIHRRSWCFMEEAWWRGAQRVERRAPDPSCAIEHTFDSLLV